ncbi:MAG TPA: hypothetical protein VFA43_23615 [Gemmatimonadaceae bacterium]|nr:hypothetical protein [Gemmatimonadaceae bacterium]
MYGKTRLASLFALGIGVVACGSSTGPSSRSAALRASYVDSVEHANCATDSAANAACTLSYLTLNVMWAGAVPTRIEVQTPSGVAHWWAIAALSYQATAGRVDTNEYIVAYPDTTFTSGVLISVYNDSGPGFGGGSVYLNNTYVGGAVVSGSTQIKQVTSACVAVAGLSFTGTFPIGDCHYAQFAIAFSFDLGGLGATATVQNINGIVVTP